MNSGIMPNFHEVFGEHLSEQFAGIALDLAAHGAVESDALVANALFNDVFEAGERAAENEQDVGGVDLDEFLVRVLASTLGRDRGRRAFQNLQQRLLNTFAGDIARDRRVLALTGDLVDLVDVDNACLRPLDVEVGC